MSTCVKCQDCGVCSGCVLSAEELRLDDLARAAPHGHRFQSWCTVDGLDIVANPTDICSSEYLRLDSARRSSSCSWYFHEQYIYLPTRM